MRGRPGPVGRNLDEPHRPQAGRLDFGSQGAIGHHTAITGRHIAMTAGISGGKPRIAGHRITVENIVVWHEQQGRDAAQIVEEYDLALAEVHAALAYYDDHRPEIDRAMELGRAYVEACRRGSTSKVAEKLRHAPHHRPN